MRKHLKNRCKRSQLIGLLSLIFSFFLFLTNSRYVHAAPPANFQSTQIVGSGLSNPTGLGIAPDGRIFILEQSGTVRIYKNGQMLSQPFTVLPTSQAGGDLGLLGIAFDPDFPFNHYVYFYYTSTASLNSVARFDASGDVAPTGPFILYESSETAQTFHAGGTIEFGNDKKLYLSVGDNGYPPNAQDLSNSAGKILRFNSDGSIPSDNPFVGQAGKLPEIWAYGLRNPFRFQFDKTTGRLYEGDVGQETWEEVNIITKGSNYGWPTCEGNCSVSGMTNPIYTYSHNGLSSSITGGLVYRGSTFPTSYQGSYFVGDYARGFMKNVTLDSSGNSTGATDFDTNIGSIVDLKQAADGSIYYVTIFPGRLYQLTYSSSNHVPIAKSAANKTTGTEPLTINFSSVGSTDPDGTPLTFNWNFGDGTTSTSANPSKTYNNPGKYTVTLTVSDGTFQAQATPIIIQVGNPPIVNITSPANNSNFKAGDTINYAATGTNSNGQPLPDSGFVSEVIFHHLTHTHPFMGPLAATKAGQFVIPTTGETSSEIWYEIRITATDANGLSTTKSVTILPLKVNVTFNTNPAGLQVIVDSQVINTPGSVETVVGFKREINVAPMQLLNGTYYQFDTWSDGGSQKHFYTTPNSNANLTANLKSTPAFSATYFNNITLSGTPVLTRNEGMIDYDFGSGSPNAAVNSDNFSARYVKQHSFSAGTYKFDTLSDDGVRLYIDGTLVIDKWIDQAATPYSANVTLTAGNHEIKLEYYEKGGGASVKLTWEPTSAGGAPTPTPPAGQSISSLTLINADTNQPIAGFETIPANATLNLSTLPTKNLNIRANANPATVGSVRFGLDANSNFGTETNAPYALASDNNGDYLPWTPAVGSHTITATPYTGQSATGTAGTPLSLTFTVTDSGSPPAGQSITSFTLINANTDQPITGYEIIPANTTLNLGTLPTRNLNIRANANPGTVGSVRFGYDSNSNFATETNAPYALASDNGGDYLPWTPTVGSHTVTATPYTAANATGTAGTPLSITFTITDSGSPPAGQSITSFSLINADTDQVIATYNPLTSGTTISLASLPTRNLNIRANSNPGTVGSVRFGLDSNSNFGTENNAPYALASDDSGNYNAWTPSNGSHTLTATPYTGQNAGGTTGTPFTITFTITN